MLPHVHLCIYASITQTSHSGHSHSPSVYLHTHIFSHIFCGNTEICVLVPAWFQGDGSYGKNMSKNKQKEGERAATWWISVCVWEKGRAEEWQARQMSEWREITCKDTHTHRAKRYTEKEQKLHRKEKKKWRRPMANVHYNANFSKLSVSYGFS